MSKNEKKLAFGNKSRTLSHFRVISDTKNEKLLFAAPVLMRFIEIKYDTVSILFYFWLNIKKNNFHEYSSPGPLLRLGLYTLKNVLIF